ncbi:MAG: SRPBCC family protein [Bacteroidota bacterium]
MAHKRFDIQKEINIDAPAEKLWEMVGPGFVEVYQWSSNVDFAKGQGNSPFPGAVCDERFCELNVNGFSNISEKLTSYNEEKMSLGYVVNKGMPAFIHKAANEWSVVPVGHHRSKLVMKATFELTGIMGLLMKGIMQRKMGKTLETVLKDAKVYAETGQVSEAKRKRIRELEKKVAV